jgi:hypothetical protein
LTTAGRLFLIRGGLPAVSRAISLRALPIAPSDLAPDRA